MQKLLLDYDICKKHLTIYCDNPSTINISKNLVQHSRTKHIEIRHHFIHELVEDDILTLEFIHTNDQTTYLFTKPLDGRRFEFLHQNISVISLEWFSSLPSLFPCICISSFCCYLLCCLLVCFLFSIKKGKNLKNTKTMCVCVY